MDLSNYVAVLRRRYLAILICLVAGLAGGLWAGHAPTKQYQATARSFVNIPQTDNVQDDLSGAQLSQTLVTTYARFVTAQPVAQAIVTSLGLKQSVSSVQHDLSATAEDNTYLIDITARTTNPALAADIANAAATALSAQVAGLEGGISEPVRAQVVDKATVPTAAVSPQPHLDLALGFILGLVAGIALVALLEALDRTIKTPQQATVALTAPLLGMIPRRKGGLIPLTIGDQPNPLSESYRGLRTGIRFLDPDAPLRVILVSSPTPDDGKTTTASNLAVALASGGQRVVIVDADLRRASLAGIFGLERAVGLTSVVLRQVALEDALQDWGPGLQVLPSGVLPPNPAEILGSQVMAGVLDELAELADVVIIDAPPILPVTDAVVLATQVDGVLMVVRHGRTLRATAAEAARRLDAVGANLVGFALNAVPPADSRAYYADYSYAERRVRPPRPPADSERPVAAPAVVTQPTPIKKSKAPARAKPAARTASTTSRRVAGQ